MSLNNFIENSVRSQLAKSYGIDKSEDKKEDQESDEGISKFETKSSIGSDSGKDYERINKAFEKLGV